MYYLECQCRFRNVWNEIEGIGAFANFGTAIQVAAYQARARRAPVRIIDDSGQVVYMAGV
jgi:hypothetical protein